MLLCIIFWFWLVRQSDRPKVDAISGSTIVQQIRDASELTTTVLTVERVVPAVSDKRGVLWTKGKLLYVASGNVRVGIKLDDLQSEDVQIDEKTITVALPPLRILSSSIDVKHSYVYAYDEDVLGLAPKDISLQQKAESEALSKIEAAACTDWLIATARERSEKIVRQVLEQVLKPRGYQVILKTEQTDLINCSKAEA